MRIDMNTEILEKHLNNLGKRGSDKVTGCTGIIDSVCYDLYGCIQYCLRPAMRPDGEIPSGHWFDVTRLVINDAQIIPPPAFHLGYIAEGNKGPADKPLP
jgi:hypothetical protein